MPHKPLIVSSIGNTAGNTGMTYGTVVLSGQSNITLSQATGSNGVVTIGISGQNTTAALTAASQFVAASATVAGTNISGTIASNGISLSAAAGGAAATLSYYEPSVRGSFLGQTIANGTVYFQPFTVANNVSMYRAHLLQIRSYALANQLIVTGSISGGSASSGTGIQGFSGTLMVWSRVSTGTNASSSNISSYYSNSYSYQANQMLSASWATNVSSATVSFTLSGELSFISSINSTGGITTGSIGSTFSGTFSSTSNAANTFSSRTALVWGSTCFASPRPIICPFATSISAGEYWFAHIMSTSTASTNQSIQTGFTDSVSIGCFQSQSSNFLEIGSTGNSNNSNFQWGWGSYSQSTQTNNTIPLSQISGMSQIQTWFNFMAAIK